MKNNLEGESFSVDKPKKWARIISFFTFAVVLLVCIFAFQGCFGSTDKEKLQLTNVKMSVTYNEYLGYSVKITGTAKNVSGRDCSYASVEFSVYDADGNNLGTALDNINHLGKNENWNFEATLFSFPKVEPKSYKLVEVIATSW